MDIIFREIREFGESLILLDQHPSKISLFALGNTYCTICMNLKHKTDINAMAQCMLLDKEKDILGSLDVGQAVVKLQGRIVRPFQIVIPLFKVEKGKITDADVKKRMKDIAPILHEQDFRLPDMLDNKTSPEPKSGSVDSVILAFLWDIRQFPASGIAARYKRLKMSVRQGQKLKEQALQQGLIAENAVITKTGRIKIIRLTEEGKSSLAKH